MRARLVAALLGAALGASGLAVAQEAPPPGSFLGSAPAGTASPEPLTLSLEDAIARGLQRNLALLLSQTALDASRAAQKEAKADLLPDLAGNLLAVRQTLNLAAFGFTLPGVPPIIGPFNVFDARVAVTEDLVDIHATRAVRAAGERVKAAEAGVRGVRDLVVLACGNLYLQTVAEASRIQAAESQVKTAETLFDLARDRKQAGLAPAIEVLRAQVELAAERQRLISARNRFEQQKLRLARAIGLPAGQPFTLSDDLKYASLPGFTPENAVARALSKRAEVVAADRLVAAAEATKASASARHLPSLGLAADYGTLGNTVESARPNYSMSARVKVPVFDGGRTQAKVAAAEAELARRQAQAADLRGRVDYEVRSALLDLGAADEQVKVADSARQLAAESLTQAQDRFAAGVAGNVEVVQAQEALARATESWIDAVYSHSTAKGALAQALGGAETTYMQMVRGQ